MGETTAIKWTDHTFNPWMGCTKVAGSPACDNCYAEALGKRTGRVEWGDDAKRVVTSDGYWSNPTKWDRAAAERGRPALVFCASLADVFEGRDDLDEHRARLWSVIESTPHLIWQLLTKRPENVSSMVPTSWVTIDPATASALTGGFGWPSNVWIGTTVEDQAHADERIPHLLSIPAPVRFLSCEPLLGPLYRLSSYLVDVDDCGRCGGTGSLPVDGGGTACPSCFDDPSGQGARTTRRIHWVIVGGESGPGHRPLDLNHARHVRLDCASLGVPFFFKQVGGRTPTAGGALLDGVEYHAFPPEAGVRS